MNLPQVTPTWWIPVGVIAVGGVAGWIVIDHLWTRPVGSDSVVAEHSPAVEKQPTQQVQVKAPVKVYTGRSKELLKLPTAVQEDAHQQVLASSQIAPDLRPQTVTTVINTETGAAETYVKTDPYPWLAYEPRGEARVMYGYKYDARLGQTRPAARLQVQYDPVRIKALTAGITAHLDNDGSAFVGAGLSYRW